MHVAICDHTCKLTVLTQMLQRDVLIQQRNLAAQCLSLPCVLTCVVNVFCVGDLYHIQVLLIHVCHTVYMH